MIDINPLEVLNKRKVEIMPRHFSRTKISERDFYNESFENWIRSKLKGRYCVKKYPNIDSDGKLKTNIFVGFEKSSELTYFLLACPYLRRM